MRELKWRNRSRVAGQTAVRMRGANGGVVRLKTA